MFIFLKELPQIFTFFLFTSTSLFCEHAGGKITPDGAGAHLHVPEPELRAVVRSAGDKVGVVGTPGQVGDSVGVTL